MNPVPNITLNDGNTIPQLGFGVYQIEPENTAKAVSEALGIGYRHIDTAEMYGNEKEVGEAVRDSGLGRGDVFITSKLSNSFHEPDDARRAFDETLSELGFDYVDLFLIHWPLPTVYDGDYVSTWKALEEFKGDGRARSIGVSNFQIEHLESARRRDGHGARGKPDRGPPLPHQRGRARLRPGARDRHRGVVPDRAGRPCSTTRPSPG